MLLAVFATPFRSEKTALTARELVERAMNAGFDVRLSTTTVEAFMQSNISVESIHALIINAVEQVPESTDFIISLGGDGTFLRAARWSGYRQVPIAGVNLGHLGYLAAFSPDDIEQLPDMLLSGCYDVEERAMLSVEYPAELLPPDADIWPYALNEVAVLKQDTASMISIPVSINGRELGIYRSDGLIIATPTGSTGYSLSVGGPVLQPTVPALVLSPVADHSLTMRPMVISNTASLEITAQGRTTSFRVSLDGNSFTLPAGTPVKISKARFVCKMVTRKGAMFASTLRSKLLWGESIVVD